MHPPLRSIIVGNSRSNLAHEACTLLIVKGEWEESFGEHGKICIDGKKRYSFISSFSKTCSCLPNFKTYWEFLCKSYLEHFFFIQSKQWPWRNSNSQNFIFSTTFAMGQIYAWLLDPHTFGGKLVAPNVKKFLQIYEL